jgi:threonylcarbamoyladenosine tRNA methylthiotransferase MtaB
MGYYYDNSFYKKFNIFLKVFRMNLYFFSFGCKVNQVEFENLKEEATLRDFQITNNLNDADIVLINSCAVTDKAVKKFNYYISKIKKQNPNIKIAVTGCVADLKKYKLKEKNVDYVITNAGKHSIFDSILAEQDCFKDISDLDTFEQVGKLGMKDKTRAFIKIQDGCDSYCSYCIIPSLRGKPRSKSLDAIKNELKELVKQNYKEIVLVGIHIGKYGIDINSSLYNLLEELAKIEGNFRIRLSSLEVTEISDLLINLIKENREKICPHFHIPLQSGSDYILKQMNRTYTVQDYLSIVSKIKDSIPDVIIGADVIVGFPGEIDQNFKETISNIEKSKLDYLHVFSFSVREGTKAYYMDNKIEKKVIDERAKILRSESDSLKFSSAKKYAGKTLRVLTEKNNKGLTDNYLSVEFIKPQEINTFVTAKIFSVQIDGTLAGEVINV